MIIKQLPRLFQFCLVTIICTSLPSDLRAHFVFVKSVRGDDAQAHEAVVYFSESGHIDGERLPERIKPTKLWLRSGDRPTRKSMKLSEEDRVGLIAMFAELHTQQAFSLEADCDYGLYHGSRLRYFAKHIRCDSPTDLSSVARAVEFTLDIVPSFEQSKLVLTTLWQGEPKADVNVVIETADGEIQKTRSDRHGRVVTDIVAAGFHVARANYATDARGKVADEAYDAESYYTTLTLAIASTSPSEPIESPSSSFDSASPKLPEAISSFGGVTCDGHLYIYSGHIGKAHAHSKHNLSGHFRRLKLDGNSAWQELPVEAPMQGLSLVTHGGHIYRIGGLRALNDDVDLPDLHSTNSFARFDPATKTWTSLTSLPAARSSHDAVVIGDQLFVVGGWKLDGDEDGTWHRHALVANLGESPIVWQRIPVPFQRRALAAASMNGNLYVIGGMNEDHDVVRTVSIYDPETESWNSGPELPGDGMQGFGVSAWNLGGRLFASGTDGRLYRLSLDGEHWETVGHLATPRFFHRLVPTATGDLLAVGGASLQNGHLTSIELLPIATASAEASGATKGGE